MPAAIVNDETATSVRVTFECPHCGKPATVLIPKGSCQACRRGAFLDSDVSLARRMQADARASVALDKGDGHTCYEGHNCA